LTPVEPPDANDRASADTTLVLTPFQRDLLGAWLAQVEGWLAVLASLDRPASEHGGAEEGRADLERLVGLIMFLRDRLGIRTVDGSR
jgi:hypothetical protein